MNVYPLMLILLILGHEKYDRITHSIKSRPKKSKVVPGRKIWNNVKTLKFRFMDWKMEASSYEIVYTKSLDTVVYTTMSTLKREITLKKS